MDTSVSNISVFFFSSSACARSAAGAASDTATGCGARDSADHQTYTVPRARTGSYRSRCAGGSAGT